MRSQKQHPIALNDTFQIDQRRNQLDKKKTVKTVSICETVLLSKSARFSLFFSLLHNCSRPTNGRYFLSFYLNFIAHQIKSLMLFIMFFFTMVVPLPKIWSVTGKLVMRIANSELHKNTALTRLRALVSSTSTWICSMYHCRILVYGLKKKSHIKYVCIVAVVAAANAATVTATTATAAAAKKTTKWRCWWRHKREV